MRKNKFQMFKYFRIVNFDEDQDHVYNQSRLNERN